MKAAKQRVAVVTGASRGIGAATAAALAAQGHHVVLLARGPQDLESVRVRLRAAGRLCDAIECDVADVRQVNDAFGRIAAGIGTVSILVNNAGYGGPFHSLDQVSDEEWDLVFRTNVRSVFACSRCVLPAMREQGFGRIVNVASVQAHVGAAGSSTYVASKHAVIGYTKTIAAEWGGWGITCNAVSPGYTATDMGLQPDANASHAAFIARRIPARAMGAAEDVAAAIAFLAGEQAGQINGAVLPVDGGLLSSIGFDAAKGASSGE